MEPLLKLCGNHSANDTTLSLNSTADYIGFVFAKSKRQVTNNEIKEWLKEIDKGEKEFVALFVNETPESIKDTISDLPIDVIQCHGNETVEHITKVKKLTNLPVWKVIHHHEEALKIMQSYQNVADGYVVDCKVGHQWGGTGISFDWSYIPAYLEEGRLQQVPVFIAGGINPTNIERVLKYQPDGIDVSSGIEEVGKKSKYLIKKLEERMNRYDNNTPR